MLSNHMPLVVTTLEGTSWKPSITAGNSRLWAPGGQGLGHSPSHLWWSAEWPARGRHSRSFSWTKPNLQDVRLASKKQAQGAWVTRGHSILMVEFRGRGGSVTGTQRGGSPNQRGGHLFFWVACPSQDSVTMERMKMGARESPDICCPGARAQPG